MAQAKGLGKGISALLEDDEEIVIREDGDTITADGKRVESLAINQIQPGKYQPRRQFDEEKLQELADSIKQNGVMQPIVVRPVDEGAYEIIAGERRWRAAQKADLKEMPAIVRDIDDKQALELALIENIQRQDLNPVEEAQGYRRLMDEFSYTQEELAKSVGKSRSHVANLLRLLQLPDEIKRYVDKGQLSMGHARSLLSAEEPLKFAKRMVDEGLSVRQAEQLVQYGDIQTTVSPANDTKPTKTKAPKRASASAGHAKEKDEDIIALEQSLSDNIGLNVEITDQGQHGNVTIHYDSLEQLDDILRRLGGVH